MTYEIQITGLGSLIKALKKEQKKAETFNRSAIVGYATRYSIYVHEDMQRPVRSGRRKFLTTAEVDVRPQYVDHIKIRLQQRVKTNDYKMGQILTESCKIIRLKSQEWVPVDKGLLHDSAFEREDNLDGRQVEQSAE